MIRGYGGRRCVGLFQKPGLNQVASYAHSNWAMISSGLTVVKEAEGGETSIAVREMVIFSLRKSCIPCVSASGFAIAVNNPFRVGDS